MRVTLSDGSFVYCSTTIPLYLKLYRNLHSYSSGVSKIVDVGSHVLCHVFLNLTSDVVLGMDWLHAINPRIDWHTCPLSLDYIGHNVRILST